MAPITQVTGLFYQVPFGMLNSTLTVLKANQAQNTPSRIRPIYLPNGHTTPSQLPTLTFSERSIAAKSTRPLATEDGPFGFEPPAARLRSITLDERFGFDNEISIPPYRQPEIFGFGSDPSGAPFQVVHRDGNLYYRPNGSKC